MEVDGGGGLDEDIDMGPGDIESPGPGVGELEADQEEGDAPAPSSDSEDDDPFEGCPDEIFLEDSDEEDEPIGADFGAAPWLQGLSAQDCLEEVFNIDAARSVLSLLNSEFLANYFNRP